jgi:hypothetical protein
VYAGMHSLALNDSGYYLPAYIVPFLTIETERERESFIVIACSVVKSVQVNSVAEPEPNQNV